MVAVAYHPTPVFIRSEPVIEEQVFSKAFLLVSFLCIRPPPSL
jgi:hypothetical protein